MEKYQTLLTRAKKEIDEEDEQVAMEELKKYLKMGRWDRVRHPVFQKGLLQGFITACIMFTVLIFILGPIFCKG